MSLYFFRLSEFRDDTWNKVKYSGVVEATTVKTIDDYNKLTELLAEREGLDKPFIEELTLLHKGDTDEET